MKNLIRLAARLYPASWRQRYGHEFAALLEDVGADWRTSVNVMRVAIELHLQIWTVGKILTFTGAVGALVALGVSFAMPTRYSSISLVEYRSPVGAIPTASQAVHDYLSELLKRVESRTEMVTAINAFGLYQNEPARMSMDDIVEMMQKRISIRFVSPSRSMNKSAVAIQFLSDDPATAQNVTRYLTSRLIDQNVRPNRESRAVLGVLEVVKPASLPKETIFPNRLAITAAGLTTGLVMGLIFTGLRRSRKSA